VENNRLFHISSNNVGKTVLKGKKKERRLQKSNYSRYFVGRPYEIFKGSIKSRDTLILYQKRLFDFCEYLNMDTEDIIFRYGPVVISKGKSKSNLEGQIKFQKLVEDYVLMLQNKVNAVCLCCHISIVLLNGISHIICKFLIYFSRLK
jgi:uncharacterized protein YvpB